VSGTSITERITITWHPDGSINVEARAPRPVLYGDQTYNAVVFDGFCGNLFAFATTYIGEIRHKIPAVELADMSEAETYLVTLATLALAANGVTL
jgi:hypothetical protein